MNSRKENSNSQWIISILGIFLCVVFGFMLICNVTIIIKGTLFPDTPPSVLGITPMVVQSGSMSGDAPDHIEIGDLIFTGKADIEKLTEGDIISFMEGSIVVTHRIIAINREDGKILLTTKGDANNAEDSEPVTADNLVGIYKGRIPKMGDFIMLLQRPVGMMLFVGVPLVAFIIYDIIRRSKAAKKENKKMAAMEAELQRLRRESLEGENPKASGENRVKRDVSGK